MILFALKEIHHPYLADGARFRINRSGSSLVRHLPLNFSYAKKTSNKHFSQSGLKRGQFSPPEFLSQSLQLRNGKFGSCIGCKWTGIRPGGIREQDGNSQIVMDVEFLKVPQFRSWIRYDQCWMLQRPLISLERKRFWIVYVLIRTRTVLPRLLLLPYLEIIMLLGVENCKILTDLLWQPLQSYTPSPTTIFFQWHFIKIH